MEDFTGYNRERNEDAQRHMTGTQDANLGANLPTKYIDNAERLHKSIVRMDEIISSLDRLIDRVSVDDITQNKPTTDSHTYAPSLQALLQHAPEAIDEKINQSIQNVETIARMIYGEG
jgi:hypothetical protein